MYSDCRPDTEFLGSDAERRLFLSVLAETVERFGWSCLSYCLMENHYHLIVRTPEGDLDVGMHWLAGQYVRRWNARRRTRGPVLNRRYGAKLLTSEAHFAEAMRYVPLNPRRAGLVSQPSAWPWSSHRAMALETVAPGWLDVEGAHSYLAERSGLPGPEAYLALLNAASDDLQVDRHGPFDPLSEERTLTQVVGDGTTAEVHRAHVELGFSTRAIAAALGCHATTVARRLRRYEEQHLRPHDDPRGAAVPVAH